MKSGKILKKTIKVAGGVCAAIGVVAVTSVIASKETVDTVCKGFKTAKKCMERIILDVAEEIEAAKEETAE